MLNLCTETLGILLGILVCTVEGADTGFYVVEKVCSETSLSYYFIANKKKIDIFLKDLNTRTQNPQDPHNNQI
jgi:hypothetical protein